MNKNILLLGCLISSLTYAQLNEKGDEKSEIKLEESIITSVTGFETKLRSTSASIKVVTKEEIKAKSYKTVAEALEDTAVVNVNQGSFGPVIDMRGQGGQAGKNVQLMIDGVPIRDIEGHSGTSVNIVAITDVERIEIIPGGGSVLYGSGTSAGVVNIITKKESGTRASVGYDYTNFGTNKKNVSVGHTFDKLDVSLSYSDNDEKGYRDNQEALNKDFQGKLRYEINKNHNIEFKYSNNDGENISPDYLTKSQIEVDREQGDRKPYPGTFVKDDYIISYNGKLENGMETNALFYKTKIDKESFYFSRGEWSSMKSSDEKKGIETKIKVPYGDNNSTVFGIDYQKNNADGRFEVNKDTVAGFVLNNNKYNNFEFTQGIRYEKSEYSLNGLKADDINNVAYELSANYLYSDTGKMYIRYDRGFFSPNPSYRIDYLPVDDPNSTETIQTPNKVKSETSNGVEIGMSDYIGISTIDVSAFYTITEDELAVQWLGEGHGGARKYINRNETTRYGIGINLSQNIGKFELSQSYQYLNAKISEGINDGNKISDVPEHKLVLDAKYNFTDRFNIIAELIYKGSIYIDDKNTEKNGSHSVSNLRFNYNVGNGLDIHGGVKNLFDKEYYDDISMSGQTKKYNPAPERNYYIGFDYRF